MTQYDVEELGFLDEMSKDERTTSRRFRRLKKGERAVKKRVFVFVFTAEKFKVFLQEGVFNQLPLCSPYPGKLSVLVMDNAKCHHGYGVADLVHKAAFSKIKAFIHRNQDYFSTELERLIYDMYIVMDQITDSDALRTCQEKVLVHVACHRESESLAIDHFWCMIWQVQVEAVHAQQGDTEEERQCLSVLEGIELGMVWGNL
ncbi:hypothetical protein BDR05DRAFT_950394 [Suillus weaverae]|nr:hypothetical protein BDR05DRAFT_950394 [Suillus weaverae]